MNLRKILNKKLLWLFVPMLLGASQVQAQEKEMLADMWVMQPKAGMGKDFNKALADHMAHRKSLGDPRVWQVYRPVLGNELNSYIIRSCCFEWKDLDSYDKWVMDKDPMTHWNSKVDDKVAHYGHYMSILDMENSNWSDGVSANFVGVTYFKIKQGHGRDVEKAMKTISDVAKEHKWPYSWSWSYPVGGEYGMNLAIPFDNYAAMTPPEEKFNSLMVKHFGSEEKAQEFWEDWNDHFETTEYSIYRLDKELSMPAKK